MSDSAYIARKYGTCITSWFSLSPQYKLNWRKKSSLCLLLPLKVSGGKPLSLSVVVTGATICGACTGAAMGACCAIMGWTIGCANTTGTWIGATCTCGCSGKTMPCSSGSGSAKGGGGGTFKPASTACSTSCKYTCYSSFNLSSIYAVKYYLTMRIHLYQLSFLISMIPSLHYCILALSDLTII